MMKRLLVLLFLLTLIFLGRGVSAEELPDLIDPPATVSVIQIVEDDYKIAQKKLAHIRHLKRLAHLRAVRQALIEKLTNAPLQPNTFTYGNCTFLTAGILNVPWQSGNANRWDDQARYLGLRVDGHPATGAIAQTDDGWAGHVAVVLDFTKTKVLIREMNFRGFNVDSQRWAGINEFVYIHL